MFYADLHVHSKFSRATSRDCDLEHLALWAAKKGIAVVATGDFTHPGWFEEIETKLLPAEPGLFRLAHEAQRQVDEWLAPGPPADVRFMLEVEISTIYKRDGRTRKVHHVVYAPDFDVARRFSQSLGRIGNIGSDGRPILGLDSRDLLEIVLSSGEGCYLVPAHVWTPWFSVLGSKSGFDAIEHCYGDLSREIFALETGLSSDPPMNWRVSSLDRYALVSNSDAHSPRKLGREACVFDTARDYFAMREALRTGHAYGGTVEFFPEEGKYHLDGHRNCGVCLPPEETRRLGATCPECGKPLTVGVMYRVCELADREERSEARPPRAAAFRSFIPLEEVLGEILGVGPQSKTVQRRYDELLARIGPELYLLEAAPLEDLRRAGSPPLAEAIRRMRSGRVIRQAGFDGQYGVIRLFSDEELRRRTTVGLLFDFSEEAPPGQQKGQGGMGGLPALVEPGQESSAADKPPLPPTTSAADKPPLPPGAGDGILDGLDPDQRAAAEVVEGPLLIVAGPGTGKTRTLTHRLAHLVADVGVPPEACLALTFSRRAAAEMAERLERLLPAEFGRVPVMTFHALGLAILREQASGPDVQGPLRVAGEAERVRVLTETLSTTERRARQRLGRISRWKRGEGDTEGDSPIFAARKLGQSPAARKLGQFPAARKLGQSPEDRQTLAAYERALRERGWVDFDDLLLRPVELLEADPALVEHYRGRYRFISIDEYQDIDAVQYRLVNLLAPPDGNLCVIGDPDQAIYGFRGADVGYFQRFCEDFPTAKTVVLARNYRSTRAIVDAALQLIAPASLLSGRELLADGLGPEQVEIHACTTERAEAEFVVHSIERVLGGHTFFSIDSARVETHQGESLSFGDFAVLYRTEAQAEALVEAFARSGMPFQRRSHRALAEQPAVEAVVQALAELPEARRAGHTVVELLEEVLTSGKGDRHLLPQESPVTFSPADAQEELSLAALRSLAARHGADLPGFLSELALGSDVDLWDPRADRVSLLTLHAAKGLEFPVVFITGCEDGLLPLTFGEPDERELAEERRLFFVGMTRARLRLILTHARRRRWRGRVQETTPSPFLRDIEEQLLKREHHKAHKKPKPTSNQRMLFEA